MALASLCSYRVEPNAERGPVGMCAPTIQSQQTPASSRSKPVDFVEGLAVPILDRAVGYQFDGPLTSSHTFLQTCVETFKSE